MNFYSVKRNHDGQLTEECPINQGVKIGSFDCTFCCKNNQNTKKEIHDAGFEISIIRCSERSKLSKENQQLIIEI